MQHHLSRYLLTALLFTVIPADTAETYDGLTFVFAGKKATLYDMDKKVVNEWEVPYSIAACADLLRDSSILVPSSVGGSEGRELGMIPLPGGRLQIINWEGEVTWEYTYSGRDFIPHHDIEPVYRTSDPKERPTILVVVATTWGDKIIEVKPVGKDDAEIVWEWEARDHRCESNCTDNSAVIDPEQRTRGGFNDEADIMHTNNVSYNPLLDQIIINMKGFYEFIIIDHSTTTEEAKGSSGGTYGQGGDILYRWGNSETYYPGGDAFFKGQHGACWVPYTMPGTDDSIPGGGNFMAVDNGNNRVVEIECPGDGDGLYPRERGTAFAPEGVVWEYEPEELEDNEGSIQKLPNGNYLICSGGVDMSSMGFGTGSGMPKTAWGGPGADGYVYEVTKDKNVVWELTGFGKSTEACRYAYSYLDPPAETPVEKKSVSAQASVPTVVTRSLSAGRLSVSLAGSVPGVRLSLYTLDGKQIIRSVPANTGSGWNVPCSVSRGTYLLKIASDYDCTWSRIAVTQ